MPGPIPNSSLPAALTRRQQPPGLRGFAPSREPDRSPLNKTEAWLTRSREGREEAGASTSLKMKEPSVVMLYFAISRFRVNQIEAH
jgi:hypothetical protein